MQRATTSSTTEIGATSHEDDILSDLERLLGEPHPDVASKVSSERHSPIGRRVVSFVLLAGVGAALALMVPVKDALLTGRSVAHTPDR